MSNNSQQDANFINCIAERVKNEQRLKKQAAVELEVKNQIIKCGKTSRRPKSSGEHNQRKKGKHIRQKRHKINGGFLKEWSITENESIINYLVEKSKHAKTPLILTNLCQEYIENNGSSRTSNRLQGHIRRTLFPRFSKLENFDTETKIKMIFALSVPVDQEFLNTLRKDGSVDVDEKQRITRYTAKNRKLNLRGDHSIIAKRKADRIEKSKVASIRDVLKIEKEAKNDGGEKDKEVKLVVSKLTTRSGRILKKRRYPDDDFVCGTTEKVSKSANSTPVIPVVKNTKKESVANSSATRPSLKSKKQGKDGKIPSHRSSNQDIIHQTQKQTKSNKVGIIRKSVGEWSKAENENLVKFIAEKSKQSILLCIRHLGAVFAQKIGFSRTARAVQSKIHQYIFPNVSKLENLDIKTRMRILFVLSAPVDSEFLIKLRENATVKIDGKQRIIKYKANDGSLELIRDHSRSAKGKKIIAEGRRRSEITYGSETDEDDSNDNEDVIYDGPGDPPRPIQLPVKREPMEYEELYEQMMERELRQDLTLFNTHPQHFESEVHNIEVGFDMANGSNEESSTQTNYLLSSNITDELTSGSEFLKLLRGLVDTLESPILGKLRLKIDDAIKTFGNEDHKVPTDDIVQTLNTGLLILNKNASMTPPLGNFTSLRDFYLILRSTLATRSSSSLKSFQLKMKECINKLGGQDKFVSIQSIKTVLDTVLLLVIS